MSQDSISELLSPLTPFILPVFFSQVLSTGFFVFLFRVCSEWGRESAKFSFMTATFDLVGGEEVPPGFHLFGLPIPRRRHPLCHTMLTAPSDIHR